MTPLKPSLALIALALALTASLVNAQGPTAVVTGKDVKVRACASSACRIMTTVSQNTELTVLTSSRAGTWQKVRLADGRTIGWVRGSTVQVRQTASQGRSSANNNPAGPPATPHTSRADQPQAQPTRSAQESTRPSQAPSQAQPQQQPQQRPQQAQPQQQPQQPQQRPQQQPQGQPRPDH
jgi:uncharacterized protein YgiM (DUF1202 family)